ncbi:MAG: helix-turn-helix domain-containing protein [Oscillospiraceae bacterium]|nr:helix-turn-helix domain-containing protein [Oscillospiraceae bacterium]
MFDNKKLGAYIQFLRKSKGLTQSRLAEMLGLSPQAVSNWERGESMPDIALLTKIARTLGTTVDRMLSAAEDFNEERYKRLPEEPEPEPTEPSAEPKSEPEQKKPYVVNLGELSELIKGPVMEALSALPDHLQPLLKKAEGEIKGALGDIEDALGEAGEALKTSLNADRVIVLAKSRRKEGNTKWDDVMAMAPFASEETLDRLVRDLNPLTDLSEIHAIAPFVSGKTIEHLILTYINSGGKVEWDMVAGLAPFCDDLDALLEHCDRTFTLMELLPLAPFLDEETIDRLIHKQMDE